MRPEYRVTAFQARDELTILTDICEQAIVQSRTHLVVVHGAGGAGKTRLALELADRMRQRGWYAGPLHDTLAAADPASLPWLGEVTVPLLVIVDYADTRTLETAALLRVLQQRLQHHTGPPAVVLLTARSIEGDWFTELVGDQTAAGHPVTVEEIDLPDAHPSAQAVFRTTISGIKNLHPDDTVVAEPGYAVIGTRWTTLDLVLLGWLAARGTALPTSQGTLYTEVLDHEQRYWARSYTGIDASRRPDRVVLAQSAACLTLLAPSSGDATIALARVPLLERDDRWRRDIARTLITCLDPGPGEALTIRPDPVGDHHLLTVLAGQPELLMAWLPADTSDHDLVAALLVLTRAGQSDLGAVAQHMEMLLRRQPGRWQLVMSVAARFGGPAQRSLESLVVDPHTPLPLAEISRALPERISICGGWRCWLVSDCSTPTTRTTSCSTRPGCSSWPHADPRLVTAPARWTRSP